MSLYARKLAAKREWRLYHLFFLVLYAIQSVWLVSSIGTPYRLFLEKADREGFQGKSSSARGRVCAFLMCTGNSELKL
jgi:hypothetical protein